MFELKHRRKSWKTFFFIATACFVIWNYVQMTRPIRFTFPLYGQASWYSRTDPGIQRTTANNEIFDDQMLTCAIWGVEFGTLLQVTNLDNGQFVIVRVNDRGPHRRFVEQGRVIDLTKAAFKEISPAHKGLVSVKVEKVR